MPAKETRFYRPTDVAKLIGCDARVIRRWIREGACDYWNPTLVGKSWMMPKAVVDQWIQDQIDREGSK